MRSLLQLTYSRLQVNWSTLFSCAVGGGKGEGGREAELASCKAQFKAQHWQEASADLALCSLSTSLVYSQRILPSSFTRLFTPLAKLEGSTNARPGAPVYRGHTDHPTPVLALPYWQ